MRTMFVVLSRVTFSKSALPYAGPLANTKDEAIDGFVEMGITNGECPSELLKGAEAMKANEPNTLVTIYDGDEAMCVTQMEIPQ